MLPSRKLLILTIAILVALPAMGAGYSLFEQGAKATAMGGAFAATADDPSAIFYNVAGIAFQRETRAMMGSTMITFKAEFESDPNQPFPGEDPNNPGNGIREFYEDHTFVLPNTYFIMPVGENMTFGIGQFTAFGLRTDWENGHLFSGRFISQDANLKTASIQPSFAWKTADDRFAIGAGVEIRAAHVSLERNIPSINPFTQRVVDIAHVRLDSDWENEIGWNVGVIWAPNNMWRIGLSHRAEMDIDFGGEAKFTQVSTGNPQLDAIVAAGLPPDQGIQTSIPFPSFTHLGIATTAIPEWTVEFDIVRMNWSVFEGIQVAFDQTPDSNISLTQGWEDVYSYRLGGVRPVSEHWDIALGAVYDENPQPVQSVGPLLPDSDRVGVSFGFLFNNGKWSLELTEFFLQFKERDTRGMNQDNYNGTYETTANLVTAEIGYTF